MDIEIFPSINDSTGDLHKLSVIDRIFWKFGYIDAFDLPIARKNRITGIVEVKRYNESFRYWSWMEVSSKYKSLFKHMSNKKQIMENFFYNDTFYRDISELIEYFADNDIVLGEIEKLPDDWFVEIEQTTLEKMFIVNQDFVTAAIVKETDTWADRFPMESDDLFKKIENAIKQSVDIEKLNSLLPELYYRNGKISKITKQDLLDYVS